MSMLFTYSHLRNGGQNIYNSYLPDAALDHQKYCRLKGHYEIPYGYGWAVFPDSK